MTTNSRRRSSQSTTKTRQSGHVRGTQPVGKRGAHRRAQPRAGLPRLRTSERGTFKRCRWKWWQEFEELLKPKSDVPALRFGSLIHKSLAVYYKPGLKRGIHPSITFEREYNKELENLEVSFGQRVRRDAEDDEVWVDAMELGLTMMDRYVDHYGKDEQWEVIVTEQPFQQVVYNPLTYDPNHPPAAQPNAEPWFIYVGVMDGIWRNRSTKKLHIVDHKTAAAITLKYLSLDPQATSYWTWGLDWVYDQGLLSPRQKPAGMLFNIMRKAKWDDRPQNEMGQYLNKPTAAELKKFGPDYPGSVSKKQPPPYFERQPIYRDFNERERAREVVLLEYADIMRVREDPENNLYKNPGQFTCPGCWAFDICELHEIGADYEEMKRQTTKTWDPYAEHEVYAERR